MEVPTYSVEGTDRLVHRLAEIYPTGMFSDFTIYTADQTLMVHRLVICSRSEAFGRYLANIPNDSKQAHEFEIKNEHPRVVEAMIRSFYGLNYDINNFQLQMCPMLFNVKVYSLANKFEVEYLKIQAKLTFVNVAQDNWNSDEFLTAAFEAYTTTPKSDRGLWDVVVAICQKYRKDLRLKKGFEKLLEETPGLATDVVLLSHSWLPQPASERVGMVEDFLECPFCHENKIGAF